MSKHKSFKDLSQTEKRKLWRFYAQRTAKRRKLEKDVARFTTMLQINRGATISRSNLRLINIELRKIVKLPYNWTDEDLRRARETLNILSKRYLEQPFYALPDNQATVMTEIKAMLDSTKLSTKARVDILYKLLKSEVTELYLHPKYEPKPTAENALLYLTQEMGHAVPSWFNKALINLIRRNYKNEDYKKIVKDLRKAIQVDHMNENSNADLQAALDKETEGDIML